MGKLFYLPCNDYYDEYEEENYCLSEDGMDQDCGNGKVKENWFKRFIRKCLMFVLVRL